MEPSRHWSMEIQGHHENVQGEKHLACLGSTLAFPLCSNYGQGYGAQVRRHTHFGYLLHGATNKFVPGDLTHSIVTEDVKYSVSALFEQMFSTYSTCLAIAYNTGFFGSYDRWTTVLFVVEGNLPDSEMFVTRWMAQEDCRSNDKCFAPYSRWLESHCDKHCYKTYFYKVPREPAKTLFRRD